MSVSFGSQVLPTKIELIRTRRSLQTANRVHKVLDEFSERIRQKYPSDYPKENGFKFSFEPIRDRFNDADVGLMRNHAGNVGNHKARLLERLSGCA